MPIKDSSNLTEHEWAYLGMYSHTQPRVVAFGAIFPYELSLCKKSKPLINFSERYWWSKNPEVWFDESYNLKFCALNWGETLLFSYKLINISFWTIWNLAIPSWKSVCTCSKSSLVWAWNFSQQIVCYLKINVKLLLKYSVNFGKIKYWNQTLVSFNKM